MKEYTFDIELAIANLRKIKGCISNHRRRHSSNASSHQ